MILPYNGQGKKSERTLFQEGNSAIAQLCVYLYNKCGVFEMPGA